MVSLRQSLLTGLPEAVGFTSRVTVLAHPITPEAGNGPLWTPVDIVNPLLTFFAALGILLGLWMCLSAGQGGFAL